MAGNRTERTERAGAAGWAHRIRTSPARGRALVVAAFSLWYFPWMLLRAARKPFWFDELFTLRIATLPTLHDVWLALLDGSDPLPPLYYVITRACVALFGVGHVSMRLPAILGFWVLSVCVFLFVAKRARLPFAVVTLLVPFSYTVATYATEARPYGFVLGCAGLALLSWQAASERRRRPVALTAFAASLTLALSAHYFAVVLLAPFALGEAMRAIARRRIDWASALCLAIPVLALLPYLPLVRSASAYSANYWSKPSFGTLLESYGAFLDPIRIGVLFLVLVWLFLRPDPREVSPAGEPPPRVPLYEKAVLAGFVAYPVAAFALGLVVKGFVARYSLPGVVGIAPLVGLVAARYARDAAGIAFAAVLCVVPLWDGLGAIRTLVGSAKAPVWEPPPMLREAPPELPVVVVDPLAYHQLTYYADARLAPRLVFLRDAALGRPGRGDSSIRSLVGIARHVPLAVVDYADFTATSRRFLVFQSASAPQPLARLLADGATIRLETAAAGQTLYLVTLPER